MLTRSDFTPSRTYGKPSNTRNLDWGRFNRQPSIDFVRVMLARRGGWKGHCDRKILLMIRSEMLGHEQARDKVKEELRGCEKKVVYLCSYFCPEQSREKDEVGSLVVQGWLMETARGDCPINELLWHKGALQADFFATHCTQAFQPHRGSIQRKWTPIHGLASTANNRNSPT